MDDESSEKGAALSVVPSSTTGAQERCFICLGFIKDESEYFECDCGNISHESCAKRVGKCSICGKEYTPEQFLESKDFFKLIENGKTSFTQDKYEEAISWYDKALKVRSGSAYAWNC